MLTFTNVYDALNYEFEQSHSQILNCARKFLTSNGELIEKPVYDKLSYKTFEYTAFWEATKLFLQTFDLNRYCNEEGWNLIDCKTNSNRKTGVIQLLWWKAFRSVWNPTGESKGFVFDSYRNSLDQITEQRNKYKLERKTKMRSERYDKQLKKFTQWRTRQDIVTEYETPLTETPHVFETPRKLIGTRQQSFKFTFPTAEIALKFVVQCTYRTKMVSINNVKCAKQQVTAYCTPIGDTLFIGNVDSPSDDSAVSHIALNSKDKSVLCCVNNTTKQLYRNFPPKYKKFEKLTGYLSNPRKLSNMHVFLDLSHCLRSFTVGVLKNGVLVNCNVVVDSNSKAYNDVSDALNKVFNLTLHRVSQKHFTTVNKRNVSYTLADLVSQRSRNLLTDQEFIQLKNKLY